MLRLHQDTHFDFRIQTAVGDYLNPTFSVELKPHIVKWLEDHGAEYAIHRTQDPAQVYYIILEVNLEITDPDLAMLFKLTWL